MTTWARRGGWLSYLNDCGRNAKRRVFWRLETRPILCFHRVTRKTNGFRWRLDSHFRGVDGAPAMLRRRWFYLFDLRPCQPTQWHESGSACPACPSKAGVPIPMDFAAGPRSCGGSGGIRRKIGREPTAESGSASDGLRRACRLGLLHFSCHGSPGIDRDRLADSCLLEESSEKHPEADLNVNS